MRPTIEDVLRAADTLQHEAMKLRSHLDSATPDLRPKFFQKIDDYEVAVKILRHVALVGLDKLEQRYMIE